MEQSQAGAVPPERVRYRLTPFQRVLPMLPTLVVVVPWQIFFWWDGGRIGPLLLTGLLGVVLPLLSLLTSRPFGITLTPTAAVVHNIRRRTIPWTDVQAVRVEPYAGTRTVVIYEAGGRLTRLRAPITGVLAWDRGFEEKFHTIGRWWLDHRGPDWFPVPPPGAWWSGGPQRSDGNPYAPPA